MPAERAQRKACPRDPGSLLIRQMATLAGSHLRVTLKRERAWASITFAGTRYTVRVDRKDISRPETLRKLADILPSHEFAIPGHFVADILVTQQSEQQLRVDALLIVDPVET